MKFVSLLFFLTLIGCQDYNANTFDQDRFGEIELNGSANFKASYQILQNRCMNCHKHAQWAGYIDEQDWVINENLVVPADADNSQLITRIINQGGASSNMPLGGQQLPDSEFTNLKTWVNGMTP